MTPISTSVRRRLVAGGAVLVLAVAGVGVSIAAAQPQPATPGTPQTQSAYQRFIEALAKRLNVSPTNLETAIGQARADAGLPAGREFPDGRRHIRKGARIELDGAAAAIGITPEQLRSELPGRSLAQVAQAHGKTANDVATALKNRAHQRIDQAVSSGRITADQATQHKSAVDQKIDQMVNQVLPMRSPLRGTDDDDERA